MAKCIYSQFDRLIINIFLNKSVKNIYIYTRNIGVCKRDNINP